MADRSSFPSEQADKFLLRLPGGMRDRIAEAAKAAGRSMNAEVIARLESSFADSASKMLSGLSADERAAVFKSASAALYAAMVELDRLGSPMVTRDENGGLGLHLVAPPGRQPAKRRA